MRMKQSEIKRLVKTGAAIDITTAPPSEELWTNTEKLAVSRGTYGINGGLLKDRRNGQLYAITARNTALFYYF